MGKSGVQTKAENASGVAQGQAASAYNTANPVYSQMATNPTGFTPQEKANMLTASQQSLGGAEAGAEGQGNLMAARTNNAGGYQAALDDSARNAMSDQSTNALGVENKDAALKQEQQQEGLRGLSGIYGDANSTGNGYLNTAQQADQNNFWKKLAMSSLAPASSAYGSYKDNQ